MTCEDCRYHNPISEHECIKYPAILPIEGVDDICASFKPKEKKTDDGDTYEYD